MKRPDVDWPESLQILTTRRDPPTLTTTNATSAATAEAAHLAATVAAEYPGFWPEAVRGLLVHSARWTPQMETQLGTAGGSRRMRANIIRRYGFGVPTAERAMRKATDALTLIVQDTIHPFRRRGRCGKCTCTTCPGSATSWPASARFPSPCGSPSRTSSSPARPAADSGAGTGRRHG